MARTGSLGRLAIAALVLGAVSRHDAVGQGAPRAVADGVQYDGTSTDSVVAVFKGIPYAVPPVGVLRWRPPESLRPGSGNRSATRFRPSCMQTDRLAAWTLGIAAVFGTQSKVVPEPLEVSEDCLYLNVWTGAQPRSLAPVMVWIHGGSNLNGSGASGWYDGSELARRGVVVVSINYRLGVFGFLADSTLVAESPRHAAGNYALLDQIEALRWVQRNIRSFGGDPTRVTVFGESAGSIDLVHLMASPLSQGLFHRAIAQSGAPFGPVANAGVAARSGRMLSKALAVDTAPDRLAALRAAPASALLAAQDKMLGSGWLAGPNVDGWVLPDVTARIFERGEQAKVPLMIGTNALEMTTLRTYLPPFQRTVAGYRALINGFFGAAGEQVLSLYPVATDSTAEAGALALMTDLYFTCPARIAARTMGPIGQNAYLYQFTRVLPGGERLGAFHGAEISYAFGVVLPWLPYQPVDRSLSNEMMGYWTRFATTGDPNGGRSIQWPSYGSRGREYYLELGEGIVTRTDLAKDRCDALEPAIKAGYRAPPAR